MRGCVAESEGRKAGATGPKVEVSVRSEVCKIKRSGDRGRHRLAPLLKPIQTWFLSICELSPRYLTLQRLFCNMTRLEKLPLELDRYKRDQKPTPHNVFIFAATRKLLAICA